MTNRDDISHPADEHRRQAEKIALKKPVPSLDDLHTMSAEDIQRVFHELEVHQIELEMQNEELRTAQTQLEAERARFIELYDLAPVGYCTLSEKGLILEANLTTVTLFGTVRGDLVKQPISRFILKEDQDIYYLHRKKLFETGEPQECQLRMSKPDGTLFLAYLTATAGQAEDGAPVCRVVISDISERIRVESTIKKNEENLRSIADAMQETLSVIALNGTFLYANQKAIWNMSGGKSGDIIGKNIRDLIPKVEAESLIERYRSVYQLGETSRQEIKIGLKKGDTWFFNTVTPIEYGSPPIPAVLSVSLDITEHKMTGEALRESEERFKALHNASFGGIAIHDQGVILECNQGLSEISGFGYDELIGMDGLLLIAEQSREAVLNTIRSGYQKPYEAFGVRKNGEEYPLRLEARNIPYKGKMVRVVEFRDITETKQAEEAVTKSNNLLQTIINTAPIRIFYKDRDLRYMGCNTVFAKDAGVASPEDLIGKDDFQLAWKEQAELYRTDDLRVLESGTPKLSYDEPQTTPDGKQIWLRTSKVPLHNDSNEIIGVLGMYEDISDHKKAETDKTRLLLCQRAILDNLPMMAWLKDTESRLEMINEPYALTCGHKIDECIGKTDLDLFPEEMAKGFMADDLEVCRSGQKKQTEEKILTSDGIKWHLTYKTPIYDEQGLVIGTTGIAQDITETKQAENHLRMAHEKLLTILDSIDSTVYVADLNTYEILFMNQRMITDFGGNKTGDICYSVFRKNSKPCQCCTNNQLIDKDGNPAGVCVWHDKNPVTGRYYINHDRAIAWTDGRLVRMQIATDITDLKKMEAQLQQALKMEAIGTLAGGIAHDFNNILGAILGYAEMVQEDSPAGSILRHDIAEIIKAGHRARDLVKQILAFSRQAETEHLPVQPAFIIHEAIKMLRSSLPSTITITQNIDMDAGLILASPTQIHQIVMNLCTNAFHAMEQAGGTLAISLEKKTLNAGDIVDKPGVQSGVFVQLSIGDTGPGIAPELWDKIFDPYFTTKEVGKGTGMGLAIIHGIVKSYGGWVSFQSRPGKGTVFQVLLPVMTEEAVVEMKPEETVRFGNERILYIDDEQLLAEMGKSMLERLGYQVTVQTGSLEALTIFQNQPNKFDLVITDQTMPGMTGSDLARRILQIRPFMPIILCTGYSSIITEEKAKSLGIRGFAMKPLAMKSIAALIREVLD